MKKSGVIISGDAEAVNFREIRMGNIAPNTLYRSSHPIKSDKQEKVISMLAEYLRIAAVINLSDFDSEIKRKAFFAPWYDILYKAGKVIALAMHFSQTSENFGKKLKKGLQFIINTEGPWLIHCHAGVDRTGFVSMVLEALMGGTIDEIVNDYLQSFNSIFDSSIQSGDKADSLVVMQLLSAMGNYMDINNQNLQTITENYLRNKIKLSFDEVAALKIKLGANKNLTGVLRNTFN
jgi:protein tyrosine/serine phosphatase